MSRIAEFNPKKLVTRKIGGLIVRISKDGLQVRGYRKRNWRLVTWDQIAKAALVNAPPRRGLTEKQWQLPLQTLTSKRIS